MNYYIQGDCARAEEIKEAFKKLGCDVKGFDMCNNNILFFTYKSQTGGKVLSTTNANLYTANIIKTHPDYKELELPVEPKFKDGDVLVTTKIRSCPFIYRKTDNNNDLAYYYAGIDGNGNFCEGCLKRTLYHFGPVANVAPATKEQRDLLFKKMEEAGWEWDADKKELRKIKPHYDIKNFHAGMPVLVRDNERRKWCYTLYSHYDSEKDYPFVTAGDSLFIQCVPYNDDTKHLLGTTDMCDEQYINW